MKKYFEGNTYTTPVNKKRFLLDRLVFNTRVAFFWKYSKIVLNCRKLALKGIYNTENWAKTSYDIFQLIEGSGGRFEISGLENLAKLDKPVVFISNHMSTLETMVFPSIIAPYLECTFVVKDTLLTYPFFGPVMKARDPIAVSRENSREDLIKVINEGVKKLKNGISVIIFPQSTRTVEFDPKKFNSLGIKLGKKANVDVVPIAIKTDFWGNGKYIKDFGKIDRSKKIYIKFGKKISIEGNGKKEHNQIIEFIEKNLKIWSEE
ncbi:1-acyl-sn-glycerol-3-phosphate acyltransferase [Hypnocyclicus thermotrophus]|uniref:1-acyl-sn-glycerol-3-phosphate acyltransferase n=1 Tax=Hypnocyclicus thermotrophus TaxID=1627895 RepID=A0AA46I645_9FUSO|nr:lysophospholipid acyltransferase family protein [Hypnocyclicus thermotrophus]TDT70565.1 1-acyl-sn-glycerol-3-phosphate acyltransferase [Hypnocyclicus thermotrophus]